MTAFAKYLLSAQQAKARGEALTKPDTLNKSHLRRPPITNDSAFQDTSAVVRIL